MLRKISIAVAVAGVLLAPAVGFAAPNHHSGTHGSAHASRSHSSNVSRNHSASRSRAHTSARTSSRVHSSRHATYARTTTGSHHRDYNGRGNGHGHSYARVGHRYHGGVWYGHRRHYWNGQWYAYGVGACWLATPIGFVWVCGV